MAFKKLKGGPKMYRKNEDKSSLEMASPAKNYKNPQDYKVFNMGNKPTPVEMGKDYGGPKMGKDYGGPNMDYDGLKMHGKHDGPKMEHGKKPKPEPADEPRGPQMASPVKGYKSAAQRKAVHASKADGGKGNPNNPKMYKETEAGGPKMKSGFKMKSGSPFQRNFGIGASPVKAAKPDYIDIDGDGNKEESMKEAAADKKAGGPQMQSPMKVVGKYIDGELVDDETYRDFVKKTKELEDDVYLSDSGPGTKESQDKLKKYLGDEFMTRTEFELKKNPNLEFRDGSFYDKRDGSGVQLDSGDYTKYFQDMQEKFQEKKQDDLNIHKFGTSNIDDIDFFKKGTGSTGASRVTLTGKDLMADLQREFREYGDEGQTFSEWLKESGNEDVYYEAEAFKKSGKEDPQTLNMEKLADND